MTDSLDSDSFLIREPRGSFSRSGFRVAAVTSREELAHYAGPWNDLAARSAQRLPMLSHAWIASYLEHQVAPTETWFCLLVFEGRRLVGVLPLLACPRSLLWLKNMRLRTPHNAHTFGVEPLIEPVYDHEVRRLFCEYLARLFPSGFLLECHRLPQSSPSLTVHTWEPKHSFVFIDMSGTGCFVRVDSSFDDFLASLSARFRRNLGRIERKLAGLGRVETSFRTGHLQCEEYLAAFMRIEASGWKGRAGTAVGKDPVRVSFYRTLTRRLSELGWLEWHFLHVGGREIAAHLAVKVDRTLTIFKIAYDEAFRTCSPGTILLGKMIERAFTSGEVDEVNCLSNDLWMRNWGMSQRPYYDLYLHYKRPLPLFLPYVSARARSLYRWMKRHPIPLSD